MGQLSFKHQREKVTADCAGPRQSVFRPEDDFCAETENFPLNGLMSYGADEVEPFKRVAVMIDKILKGTSPSEIPVEQSTKFEFVVNLKTAKQLGLTIPPEVLARANRIIK
jgi:ABC-type uncharacterized transport system substrate-binding protein